MSAIEAAHNARHLKELSYDMNLLLVEDDETVLTQLKLLLSRFFGNVDSACNGLEAMDFYAKNSYDLVITDLTMPYMDGIELSGKMRTINEAQNIFILSAHTDSEKLIELINIGIDGFLPKPVDINRVMPQLIKICQAIYDHKMLSYLNNLLEETNKDLKKSNNELEIALNELRYLKEKETFLNLEHETKEREIIKTIHSGRELNSDEKMMLYTRSEKMSAVDFHTVYPFELDKTNEDLELLEDSFNFTMMKASNKINIGILTELVKILREYAKVMELIPQFGALAFGIEQLAKTFDSIHDPAKVEGIMPMLTHLFDNLEQWRRGIFFYKNVEDIHYMDNSLISDALSLQGILDNDHASTDDDIELF